LFLAPGANLTTVRPPPCLEHVCVTTSAQTHPAPSTDGRWRCTHHQHGISWSRCEIPV